MNATATSRPATPTTTQRQRPIGNTSGEERATLGSGRASSGCNEREVCIGCQVGADGADSRGEGTAGAGVARSSGDSPGPEFAGAPFGAHELGAGPGAVGSGVGRLVQSIVWVLSSGVLGSGVVGGRAEAAGAGVGGGVATVAMSGPGDNGRGGWRERPLLPVIVRVVPSVPPSLARSPIGPGGVAAGGVDP